MNLLNVERQQGPTQAERDVFLLTKINSDFLNILEYIYVKFNLDLIF